MSKYFRYHPDNLEGFRSDPLGSYVDGFAALIEKQHYCNLVALRKLRLVADLNRWLARHRVELAKLSEPQVEAFLETQWKKRHKRSGDSCTLALLLRHLRGLAVIPTLQLAPLSGAQDLILHDFEQFLLNERGLATGTVDHCLRTIRRFLSNRFSKGECRLDQLRPHDIIDFVRHESSCRARPSSHPRTRGLRSFLGFLFQRKKNRLNLATAIPKVAVWCSSGLPRYLEPFQVEKVLASCDRRQKVGKRDYAILLLLARLGLRAGEVINLNLEDIDWIAGELRIHGKGHRIDRLPLVKDVGHALAEYLRKGRAVCTGRRVFIQSHAPYDPVASSHTISALVQRAVARAGLNPPHRSAHMLRHSLATRMMRRGASLFQIGQVLRHRHSQSTELYAKVDFAALRSLAQHWPGGGR